MLNNKFHSYCIQPFKIKIMKKLKIMFLLVFVSSAFLQAQTWQAIGPVNRTSTSGSWQGSGLVNTIAFHPKYNTLDASIGGVITITPWPDYVFEKNYKLKTIPELEVFLKENKHLPNVPSAAEVTKEGIDVATMNAKLLEKIEELSLYIIEQNKRIEALEQKVGE
jgi:hypothetical protein